MHVNISPRAASDLWGLGKHSLKWQRTKHKEFTDTTNAWVYYTRQTHLQILKKAIMFSLHSLAILVKIITWKTTDSFLKSCLFMDNLNAIHMHILVLSTLYLVFKYACPYIFLVSCGEKGRGPGEEVVTACLTCPPLAWQWPPSPAWTGRLSEGVSQVP